MDDLKLPGGFTSRPATIDDASAVASMLADVELEDLGVAESTARDLLDDWHDTDLAEETVLVLDSDERVVAYADVLNRSYINVSVYGYVHPDFRSQGFGAWLIGWGERWVTSRMDRAPKDAEITIQHYIPATNQPARNLVTSFGYEPVRSIYTMTIDMEKPPPEPEWPEGFHLRPFQLNRDEEAVFDTAEDAFRDVWGRPPGEFFRFKAMTTRETFDPDLWVLAESEGRIQGVSLARKLETGAWIDTVGVRRNARGQGLGLALMRETLRRCYQRGIREVGLSVDAEGHTGAPRLYLRAGMRQKDHYILHRKVLRPAT